jgi:hypothetical protein
MSYQSRWEVPNITTSIDSVAPTMAVLIVCGADLSKVESSRTNLSIPGLKIHWERVFPRTCRVSNSPVYDNHAFKGQAGRRAGLATRALCLLLPASFF